MDYTVTVRMAADNLEELVKRLDTWELTGSNEYVMSIGAMPTAIQPMSPLAAAPPPPPLR